MDRRLQKLQTRVSGLRDVVSHGIEPQMDQVLACETLIEEVSEEHQRLTTEFKSQTTPAMRKLAKDFTRLTPLVMDTLSLANQACFEARMSLQQSREENEPIPVVESSSTVQFPLQQQQQFQQQEEEYTTEEMHTLTEIELKAQTVRALNEKVAELVSDQADHVHANSHAFGQAREDVVNGLGELAEAKKREAGKHTFRGTTVSAMIGGGLGLVGGPLGVVMGVTAGAVVGNLVGGTVASLSRRSIDRELRDFKRKFQLFANAKGYLSCKAQVFENECWQFSLQRWRPTQSEDGLLYAERANWTLDEIGTKLKRNDPYPGNPALPPKPLVNTSTTASTALFDLEEEDELLDGEWCWEEGSVWMPDFAHEEGDAGGWQYAYSFAEGQIWTPRPTRTSLVRRRCWTRNQVLLPSPTTTTTTTTHRPPKNPTSSNTISTNQKDVVQRSVEHMDNSLSVSEATLEEVRVQGKYLDDSARDVSIVEDASLVALRVSRAVTFGGVVRNSLSYAQSSSQQWPQQTSFVLPPVKKKDEEARNVPTNSLSHLEHLVDEQLRVSTTLSQEVDQQNLLLTHLVDSAQRSKEHVAKANKHAF